MSKWDWQHLDFSDDNLSFLASQFKSRLDSLSEDQPHVPFHRLFDHFSHDLTDLFAACDAHRPSQAPLAAPGTQLAVFSGNNEDIPLVQPDLASHAGPMSDLPGVAGPTAGVAAVTSAASAGLIINVSYDASVANAPAGFTTAVNAVVQYFQSQFSDPITVNIAVGYGEAGGNSLGGALGMSLTYLTNTTYSALRAAVSADAKTGVDNAASAQMPAADPTGLNHYWLSTAEAKALALPTPTLSVDGYVGFSNAANIFDYDNSNGVTAGQYDFFGVVAHEISEVMGRILLTGQTVGSTPTNYDLMDLNHYSAPGVRDFVGTQAGYFSVDGGVTKVYDFNTNPGGDFGDWAASAGSNAFLAFANSGVTLPVTAQDLLVMDAIGWDLVGSSPPPPPPPSPPDLHISSMTLSDTSMTFVVHNAGSGSSAASTAGIYLSTDGSITTSDILLTTVATPSLAANGSFSTNVALAFPGVLTPGTYFVGAIADHDNKIAESSESNNSSTSRAVILGDSMSNVLNGTSGADVIFALDGNDILSGGAGADILNGGKGGDLLIGGPGADTINIGAANDDLQDLVQYSSVSDFGDRISNFDVTGSTAVNDKVRFTGALNTAYDDIVDNNVFSWAVGNGVNGGNTTANLNTTAEGLFLSGNNGEGVSNASLGSSSAVAAEFNSEFNIIARAGQDALLVVNDTNGNSFAVWQYVENGTSLEIQTNELTLIGIFNANGAVATGNFDLA